MEQRAGTAAIPPLAFPPPDAAPSIYIADIQSPTWQRGEAAERAERHPGEMEIV